MNPFGLLLYICENATKAESMFTSSLHMFTLTTALPIEIRSNAQSEFTQNALSSERPAS